MVTEETKYGSADERKERFLALLEPVHDSLARFARSMTGSGEEARDLVGETVLRALENFEGLRDDRAFLSWLFTIATRLHRQRGKRSRLFGAYDEEEVARRPSPIPSPETTHDISALYRALDRLGGKERETVVLFEIAGLSLEEVRRVQGGSLSGVKSRLVRGRKKLAKLLGGEEGQGRPERKAERPAEGNELLYTTTNRRSEPFIYAAAQSND